MTRPAARARRILVWLRWAGGATAHLGRPGPTVTLLAGAAPGEDRTTAASLTLPRDALRALLDSSLITIAPGPGTGQSHQIWTVMPALIRGHGRAGCRPRGGVMVRH